MPTQFSSISIYKQFITLPSYTWRALPKFDDQIINWTQWPVGKIIAKDVISNLFFLNIHLIIRDQFQRIIYKLVPIYYAWFPLNTIWKN